MTSWTGMIPVLCAKAGASHSGSRKPEIIMDPCESLETRVTRGGPVIRD